ncbi:sporulation initiation inhibitor protein Soj [Legionella busanensis]|uniref:Sporulation initiation inhibitor protein Soj n=2 Tax=Legionella busanensis TaxID=190655 RepID=A0A378KAI0_9GAMM|nr:sporulation initiation inhibitor protein Soj [Legionella busanensis]STX81727.1 sporulation initiation inhibitor protein Soj [Legionella busanensis]
MDPKMLVSEAAEALGVTAQALHNQIKRKELQHVKSRNRVYFGHQTAKSLLSLNFKPQILCFQIVKGGTGKTSMCLAIGVRASLYGAKTLLIDLDQQGNLTKACRINTHDNPIMIELINQDIPIEEGIIPVCDGLDILPSRIENALLDSNLMLKRLPLDRVYKEMITPLKEKYDLILIDCPPALGSSVTAAALASERIIAPVTPSEFSLEGLEITKQEVKNIEKNFHTSLVLSPLLNEFDVRTSLSHETMKFLMTHYENSLIRSVIRKSQEFENVLTKGESIYDSLNNSPAREDVDLLTREILNIGSPDNKELGDITRASTNKNLSNNLVKA